MCGFNNFLHNEEINPFFNDALPILVNEFYGNFFVFAVKRFCALLFTAHDVFQVSILDYQVEDTFRATMLYMHMNRLMFI